VTCQVAGRYLPPRLTSNFTVATTDLRRESFHRIGGAGTMIRFRVEQEFRESESTGTTVRSVHEADLLQSAQRFLVFKLQEHGFLVAILDGHARRWRVERENLPQSIHIL
jgi:hypothetical protein